MEYYQEKPLRIGKISELLGITAEAIRFYENQGIITSHKSATTGYRYYGAWEIQMLIQARSLRAYNFSITETAHFLNDSSVNDIVYHLDVKEGELEQSITTYLNYLKSIRRLKSIILDADHSIGKYRIEDRPVLYRFANQHNRVLDLDPKIKELIQDWVQKVPYIFASALFSQEDSLNGGSNYSFGHCVEQDFAEFLGIEKSEYVTLYPSRPCIYTTIKSTSLDPLSPHVLRPALDYMKSQGMELTDDVVSRIALYKKQNNSYYNLHQVWLPFT